MSRRAWRVMLVVGLAGVIALAGAQIWRLDRDRGRALNEAQAFDATAQHLLRAVLDARASERAYVATGQGFPYWKPRVDQELQQIRDDLAALRAHAPADLAARIDAALEAFADVSRLEQRIADHASNGRLPHASDVIFADGLQASLTLEHATDAVIESHRAAWQAARTQVRLQELGLTAAIAAAGLLVALLLVPQGGAAGAGASSAAAADAMAEAEAKAAGAGLGLSLRSAPDAGDLRLAPSTHAGPRADARMARGDDDTLPGVPLPVGGRSPAAASAAAASAASAGTDAAARSTSSTSTNAGRGDLRLASPGRVAASGAPGAASSVPPVAAAASAVATPDAPSSALEGAASLCSAFAQASNAHDLDALLPRMAQQLDAVGLIVWLKDDEGHALKAALSHGYPDYTLTALAAIDPDSQNATARAARLAQPQIVPASGSTPGALVVPMLTSTGCVGVVSIELPAGREQDANTSALARIFAAQLAMLTA